MSKTTKTTNNVLANVTLKELKLKLQELNETIVDAIESELNNEKFHIELRDTTSCIMFIRDVNNNVVFNVYDNFRLQFTKVNADKYESELLKDERFYTFTYKNQRFISAKAKDTNDFINLCKYAYKCIENYQKALAKATEKKAKATEKQTSEQKAN